MSKPPAALKEIGIRGIGRVFVRPGTSDEAVLQQIFEHGELDIAGAKQFVWIKSRYDKMLSAGSTPLIVDCGANIGLSTLFLASQFPKARVVGIEPAADNVEVARRNTASWPLIEIIQAAAHDTGAPLRIANPQAHKWAFQVVESESTADMVEAITLNDVLRRHTASDVLVVKVDIEGGEQQLFRSNLEWLDRTSLLIVELHDWLFPGKGTSEPFFRAIAGRRFEVVQKGEHLCLFFKS